MSLAHPASCLGVSTALVLHTSEIRSTTTPMRVGQRDPAAGPAGSASEGPARSELSDAALPVASTAQAPPVVSTDLPPCFIHAREMLEEMHEIGFVIVPQLSPAVACEALKEAMKTRARYALQLMGHDLAEDCSGLLRIGKESDKSPPAAVAVQEHTCRAVAFFSQCGSTNSDATAGEMLYQATGESSFASTSGHGTPRHIPGHPRHASKHVGLEASQRRNVMKENAVC